MLFACPKCGELVEIVGATSPSGFFCLDFACNTELEHAEDPLAPAAEAVAIEIPVR